MNQNNTRLEPKKEFEAIDNKKYEVKIIIDSAIYSKEMTNGQMLGLYYLILWKSYSEEKSI